MYKYTYEQKFDFIYGDKTFVPTSTSEILLENIFADNQKLGSTLDLGTGIGFVIIMLKLKGAAIESYFASDLSTANLTYCKQNAEKFKVPVEIKQGSLFKPWDNYKFDTIINDVIKILKLQTMDQEVLFGESKAFVNITTKNFIEVKTSNETVINPRHLLICEFCVLCKQLMG